VARPAVFLDRDGVLNVEAGYIHNVEDLHLIPGVAQAVRQLNERQLFCCLVSNQSGPARGYYPNSHVEALHQRLCQLLQQQAGSQLNALYYCPHLSHQKGELSQPSLVGQPGVNRIRECLLQLLGNMTWI
jgi:D-glycero-D-manno-heptose 1,7-bisphosphate phosphatase